VRNAGPVEFAILQGLIRLDRRRRENGDMTVPDATFFTVTYIEVLPTEMTHGATLVRKYRDASRADDGAASFEVLQRVDRPNQFTVLAGWKDQPSFVAHVGAAGREQLEAELAPLLAAPIDTRQHSGLTVGGALGAGSGNVMVVTHVDVIPSQKEPGMAALLRLAEESRGHHGNLRFDVWQQIDRPNHFSVVESWSSRFAFDTHVMAAATRAFRTSLAPLTGSLYDERLYQLLD
jgi:quinol monooxygenase YgiN